MSHVKQAGGLQCQGITSGISPDAQEHAKNKQPKSPPTRRVPPRGPPPGDLPDPGVEPALQTDALPSEPPGKAKNTGVGCYFLLQGHGVAKSQTRFSD